jgi:hypothetical protein
MDWLEISNPFDDVVTDLLRGILAPSLELDERMEDVLAGGVSLARERARLLEREPYPLDGEFAFSLFCWWPLKPRVSDAFAYDLRSLRAYGFEGVASGDTERLARMVPQQTLTLDFADLYRRQAEGALRALLLPPPEAPLTGALFGPSQRMSDGGGFGPSRSHGVIKKGSKGDAVKKAQTALKARFYDPGPIDGIFGAKTFKAVKAYQSDRGLMADGIVGPKTWARLDPATVMKGSKGAAVRLLQRLLIDVVYAPGVVDGDFGPKTERAVREFKDDYGLNADGIVGPRTWAALGS